MGTLAGRIFDYSRKVMGRKLGGSLSDEVRKRIVDSIFVSYGARGAEPVKIARKALLPSSGKYNSTVYFSKEKASVEVSAFINGCMTRYLDYNDTYLTKKEFAHPSDNVPAMLCLAQAEGLGCADAIRATYLAYQVQCSLSDAASLRNRGWDHVVYLGISSAAGAAGLLGLDRERFENAINLGVSNSISMRQVRAGELSMWKGCTAANAARNGLQAALLAREGMTGPSPIFEGEMGFFRQVTGRFVPRFGPDRIKKTLIKDHPVEYNAMSSVDAALRLRGRVKGEIKRISVDVSSVMHRTIVKDPERLRPKTRETADHSMPYIIAYTLTYGEPTPSSYSERYIRDRSILRLIDRMDLRVVEKYDHMYPDFVPVRIAISATGGDFVEQVLVPKGHYRDPYSWDDLRRKGRKLVPEESWVDDMVSAGRSLERRSAADVFELLASAPG